MFDSIVRGGGGDASIIFFAKYRSLDEICMNSIETPVRGDRIKFIYRRLINFTKFDYDMLGDQKGNNRFLDRSPVIVSSLKHRPGDACNIIGINAKGGSPIESLF